MKYIGRKRKRKIKVCKLCLQLSRLQQMFCLAHPVNGHSSAAWSFYPKVHCRKVNSAYFTPFLPLRPSFFFQLTSTKKVTLRHERILQIFTIFTILQLLLPVSKSFPQIFSTFIVMRREKRHLFAKIYQ